MKRKQILYAAAVLLCAVCVFGLVSAKTEAMDNYLFPDSITASSQLYEEGYDHSPSNMQDYRMDTCWTEGVWGDGTGQYADFFIPAGTMISGFRIWNGFLKSEELFYKNNAPSMLIISSGSQTFTVDVSQTAENYSIAQDGYSFYFPEALVSGGMVRVTIAAVRKGWKYDDACISEFYLFYEGTEAGIIPMQDSAGSSSGGAADIGYGHGIDPDLSSEASFTPTENEVARLGSIAAMLAKFRTDYAPAQEMDFTVQDLTVKDRAFLLFLYCYIWHGRDSRISYSAVNGTEYNLVLAEDLRDILTEITGSMDEAVIQTLIADTDLVPRRLGTSCYLSTLANFGSFAGHYYETPYAWDVSGDTLTLYGTVEQYNAAEQEYYTAYPYIVWFDRNSNGFNYRFKEMLVGVRK